MPPSSTPPVDSAGGLPSSAGSIEAGQIDSAVAVQAEQKRIAQALHDTVSQTLTGTYLQAVMTSRKLEASGSAAADEVARLTEMIHRAVVELQEVVRQLQPPENP